ncbi:hypothetical protein BpHYR1_014952 [Brachionus plicatilis]|uniref:Uncharacterized protein n=1 Tax=Brachionus plicatilis TaxID=10195 RepID=A0A3M7Q104_BRAPC|nr:hypothetical protein BpHYR1_014952 [Brachionus plicatilis]
MSLSILADNGEALISLSNTFLSCYCIEFIICTALITQSKPVPLFFIMKEMFLNSASTKYLSWNFYSLELFFHSKLVSNFKNVSLEFMLKNRFLI